MTGTAFTDAGRADKVGALMSSPLKVLFLSSEVAPFAKTGGLADVCGALPKALSALGHDVRVVMPAYGSIEAALHMGSFGLRALDLRLRVPMGTGPIEAGVLRALLPGTRVPVSFIAERHLFSRPLLYGYWDDPYRFAFFSRAALDLTVAADGWRPDIVHAHDWHAAPGILWLATAGQLDDRYRGIPSLFTIHNIQHQGHAPWHVLEYLGVSADALREEGHGEVNFMARAIHHATQINTVSPTYAREILTPEGGAGLSGLLQERHLDLHGILNGLDGEVFNPSIDRDLSRTFDADSLPCRGENKRALQARLGLPQRADVPLLAMVSRLDRQKGLDITGHVIHRLMNHHAGEVQFVVLGAGAAPYEEMLRHLSGYHPDKMAAVLSYDAGLAPLIYGGSDMFLMPSLFEPCGLGQLIAMRYGSVPVVRVTGGLADTVREGVTGFTFSDYSADALWHALQQAIHIYRVDQKSWRAIQHHGMTADTSWTTSAQGYQQLYEWAIARARG